MDAQARPVAAPGMTAKGCLDDLPHDCHTRDRAQVDTWVSMLAWRNGGYARLAIAHTYSIAISSMAGADLRLGRRIMITIGTASSITYIISLKSLR